MYVGKSVSPDKRLLQHMSRPFASGNARMGEWLTNLRNNGLWPDLQILAVVEHTGWQCEERKWIAYHRATIYNIKDGGQNPRR